MGLHLLLFAFVALSCFSSSLRTHPSNIWIACMNKKRKAKSTVPLQYAFFDFTSSWQRKTKPTNFLFQKPSRNLFNTPAPACAHYLRRPLHSYATAVSSLLTLFCDVCACVSADATCSLWCACSVSLGLYRLRIDAFILVIRIIMAVHLRHHHPPFFNPRRSPSLSVLPTLLCKVQLRLFSASYSSLDSLTSHTNVN